MAIHINSIVISDLKDIPEIIIEENRINDTVIFMCKKHKCISEINTLEFQELLREFNFFKYNNSIEFFKYNLKGICDYFIKKEQYVKFEIINLYKM